MLILRPIAGGDLEALFALAGELDSMNLPQDEDFLRQWGVAMMVETARFWVDLGHFSESKGGAFCINNVTGPDEYSAVVDNNRYTNFMARENLRGAIRGVEFLREDYPDDLKDVVRETGLDLAELDEWRRAADRCFSRKTPRIPGSS